MAEIMEMPKLSDTMTEGVVAAWHKKVGDNVSSGELIAEIETDKATMDLESFYEGTVLHIGVEENGNIPIGGLLVIIGPKGEDVSAIISKYATEASSGGAEKTEAPAPVVEEAASQIVIENTSTSVSGTEKSDGRLKVSPLAKAMAKEKDLNLNSITGTGENGRIVKRDIEAFIQSGGSGKAIGGSIHPGVESYTDEPLSQMRKVIASRLLESKNTAPHFYLTMEIDMDNAVEARKSMNEVAPTKISFNDIVIKAVATALRQNPKINASWLGNAIRYNDHIHVGMAVAVDSGLIVPVIRFADQKSLSQIGSESKELAGRARERKLQPEEYTGSTFTISNLGMFGIEQFTAIINSPDACILAVGGIIEKPVVKNGQIVPGRTMKVTLSCDHRVVDGAVGSAFLKSLQNLLENPVRILI